ncbi:protein kinase domain-containing protein [Streptomyces sp. IBSBF 2435]|uniref:protein kinase domain-containing protein n=1 Tax=Streptomyces sp. IBSBF 2435 TaxID=2903531 RepID=UPI002FDC65F9
MGTGLYIGPDGEPDRYRLLRSIGRGGEAVLYLAELELGGATEPVVVKTLDAQHALAPDLFARVSAKWREQAELLRFVHRPGVVGIREHFEGPSAHPGGQPPATGGRALYLVMNHVQGLDLRDWRAERTLETAEERREAVRCLAQLAEVLDWLHSGAATPSGRRVVHGDLSPGNVMVDGHGQATLVDFGLSKLAADHRTAEVWFTPGFAAPEVFEGTRSPATDRYAFGAIAYFLLSGKPPAPVPETLRAALLALPALDGLDAGQAGRVAAIFAADPDARPASLTGWVRELRSYVVSATRPPLPTAPAYVPPPVPPPPVHAPPPVFRSPVPVGPPGGPPQSTRQDAPGKRRPGRTARIVLAAVVAAVLVGGGAFAGVALSGGGKGGTSARDSPGDSASQPSSGGPATGAAPPAGSAARGSLADHTPTDESYETVERGTAAINGVQYDDVLHTTDCDNGYAEYNLGKLYKKLDVVVGMDDNSPNVGMTFTMWADGRRVFRERATVGPPFHPVLNVSGVLRLRLEWASDNGLDCGVGVFADPTLIP